MIISIKHIKWHIKVSLNIKEQLSFNIQIENNISFYLHRVNSDKCCRNTDLSDAKKESSALNHTAIRLAHLMLPEWIPHGIP